MNQEKNISPRIFFPRTSNFLNAYFRNSQQCKKFALWKEVLQHDNSIITFIFKLHFKNKILKIYSLIGGGTFVPQVQTVSASLISKLVKKSGRRSLTNKIFLKNILWICQNIKNSLLQVIWTPVLQAVTFL